MKNTLTLLLLVLSGFISTSNAQTTVGCNAGFQFEVSQQLVQFHPATTDSVSTTHHWFFGDGSPVSEYTFPLHVYSVYGTYNVLHITRQLINGNVACSDSFMQTVTIINPTTACNNYANFTFTRDSIQPNKVYFNNLSTPASNVPVHWNFGDGTSSQLNNPSHVFATTGVYRVCLSARRDSLCIDDTCMMVQVQTNTPCNLAVNFSSHPDSVLPNKIYFTNLSTPLAPADSVYWTFGDGTFSTDASPSHTYITSGTFNVCLIVKKITNGVITCVREFCHTVTVTAPCNLQGNFGFVRDSFQLNKIHFTNLTTPANGNYSAVWNFGDGSISNDNNPVHIFQSSGLFNVCLTVRRDSLCVVTICRQVQIQLPACNLTAAFTAVPDSANSNNIHFINQSTPASASDSIRWTFGDGTSSTATNPVHTYNGPGTYQVCLIVRQNAANATCTRDVCHTVTIQPVCNINPNYMYFPDSTQGVASNTIHFTNTTAGMSAQDSVFWTFGDGTTAVNVANPVHSYATGGTYHVCLLIKRFSATGLLCAREECKTIVVAAPPPACNFNVNFSATPDSLHPRMIRFINLSQAPANAIVTWTFGDGTSGAGSNVVHEYAQAGNYLVCIKVASSNTCMIDTCKQITVVVPTTCNITAAYSTATDSVNRKKFYFTNLSTFTGSNATARWTFGDGTSATTWNAVHEYAQPGRYAVCVTVSTGNNCERSSCDSVLVTPAPCGDIAVFTVRRALSDTARRFIFTPATQSANLQYHWSFGDGTESSVMVAEHTYSGTGPFVACLSVVRDSLCSASSCHTVTISNTSNCDSIALRFEYNRDPSIPNKIYFHTITNTVFVQQQWTILGTASSAAIVLNQANPVFTFTDTGYYYVCVKGRTAAGCIKEYCESIYIGQVASNCVLLAYPNPAHNNVMVNIQLQHPEMIHATIYSTQNVLVATKNQQGVAGNNVVNLNIANLVPGMYFIRLVYGNRTCIARFQKI